MTIFDNGQSIIVYRGLIIRLFSASFMVNIQNIAVACFYLFPPDCSAMLKIAMLQTLVLVLDISFDFCVCCVLLGSIFPANSTETLRYNLIIIISSWKHLTSSSKQLFLNFSSSRLVSKPIILLRESLILINESSRVVTNDSNEATRLRKTRHDFHKINTVFWKTSEVDDM